MARGGVNKALVIKARESLLARGEHPSIDAVRVALGNTGSKTTIHRFLKELEQAEGGAPAVAPSLNDELAGLVSGLAERIQGQAAEQVAHMQRQYAVQHAEWRERLDAAEQALAEARQHIATQAQALKVADEQGQAWHSALQTEQTRNAQLNQANVDLQRRLDERAEHVQSLEDKHRHAREALEHYRGAVKEQRDQERQRHEGQVQQVQAELRLLQQQLAVRQEALTSLNRDNERLAFQAAAAEASQAALQQEYGQTRQALEALQLSAAQTLGANAELRQHNTAQASQLAALHVELREQGLLIQAQAQRLAETTPAVF
ncbi:DNA-binding protein [Pseudomonas sp. nanlin1]|uniref:DNA-binding protein n=1 Tax=Pseudomonas sp. nanlin1 TaxID=3040605 RepID=UPI0038907FA0